MIIWYVLVDGISMVFLIRTFGTFCVFDSFGFASRKVGSLCPFG